MQLQSFIYVIIGAFIVYRIVLRVRRSIGWQTLNLRRMRIFTVIFSIIGLIFLFEGAFHMISLISDAMGILVGVILLGRIMYRFYEIYTVDKVSGM
ncbi:hypothetical protein H1230_21305 [Paenibacillus sp. 19GGS1-52]|uniref:hypothetical protein n=1 Tax=Paenibacillus sp. 19GGS1-52 TaxID=2758563 RepID=UPI001EFB4DE0|nr:hypothetical protein [Paenibacillus sp. 19GGS1-52]ULO05598.1 hypothetical protein H1230_21305 [Paenibacillus sp. 19GGS1-52]